MNSDIKIIDTTLRDGEQAPGVCFPPNLKLQILHLLYDAGVRHFEIGTPAIGTDEQKAIKMMLSSGIDAEMSVWCRAVPSDLEQAAALGARQINLSLPVSDIQLKAIGKDRKWMFNQLKACLEIASSLFDFVTVGAQDASRANHCALKDYIGFALASPAVRRIRLADTVGIMNPFTVHDLFSKMTDEFPKAELEFHGHNDLGMATANTLAAVVAGAHAVSVTTNGLGERSGNAPLEEVVLALEYSWSTATGINKQRLQTICELVASLAGRKIDPSKPFSGKQCFTHESGIHTRSLLADPLAYQPFDPKEIGREMRFVYGKHSGSSSVRSALEHEGFSVTEKQLQQFLDHIKSKSHFSSRGISGNELTRLFRTFSESNNEVNKDCFSFDHDENRTRCFCLNNI
jgi:homocitrate synthase NifV